MDFHVELSQLKDKYDEIKTEAKKLWTIFVGDREEKPFSKKIADFKNTYGEKYWENERKHGKLSSFGAGNSNVSRIKKAVENIHRNWIIDFDKLQESINESTSLDKRKRIYDSEANDVERNDVLITNARKLVDAVGKFLTSHEGAPPHSVSNLTDKKWFVYYLHYRGSEDRIEPELGKAYLEIVNSKSAIFRNIIGDADYLDGKYVHYDNRGLGVLNFDFIIGEQGRHLHIKVNYDDPETQKIAIGYYIVCEHGAIESGNIVLEETNRKFSRKEIGAYSYISSHNIKGLLDKIHPAIKRFLSVKSESYHNLFRGIKTSSALQSQIEDYLERNNWQSRFLEKVKPEICIATPMSVSDVGFDDKRFKNLKSFIEKSFQDKISVVFPTIEDHFNSQYYPQVFRSFERLKTVRVFVLIIDEVDKLSFSHLQLGYALTTCKYVVILGRKSKLSGTLQKFVDSKLLDAVYYDDRLDNRSAWEDACIGLVKKIAGFLPVSFWKIGTLPEKFNSMEYE